MHLAVTVTLRRLLEVQKVGKQYVPFVTGPGALKEAWNHFLYNYQATADEEEVDTVEGRDDEDGEEVETNDVAATEVDDEPPPQRRRLQDANNTKQQQPPQQEESSPLPSETKQKKRKGIAEGVYTGMLGRQVTVVGTKRVRLICVGLALGNLSCRIGSSETQFSFPLHFSLFGRTHDFISFGSPSRRRRMCGVPWG
jgi:hypothetical protein